MLLVPSCFNDSISYVVGCISLVYDTNGIQYGPLMWQLSLAPFCTMETSITFLLPAISLPAGFLLICTLYPSERSCAHSTSWLVVGVDPPVLSTHTHTPYTSPFLQTVAQTRLVSWSRQCPARVPSCHHASMTIPLFLHSSPAVYVSCLLTSKGFITI